MLKFSLKYWGIHASIIAVIGLAFLLTYSSTKISPTLTVAAAHPVYVTDFSDDRKLVGASHYVFIGKVIKQLGNEKLSDGGAGTQFEIEVIENIKGKLVGTVAINQQGGLTENGTWSIADDDILHSSNSEEEALREYFLQPGSTYVLAIRENSKTGVRLVGSHPNSKKLISSDSSLTKEVISTLAEREEKVAAFRTAYKNEVLLDADVKNNRTHNSYVSLKDEI
jgi:hypothetical protein